MMFISSFCAFLEILSSPTSCPEIVHGVSVFNKKVILYGSEGSVKVFTSSETCEAMNIAGNKSSPKAVVQVAIQAAPAVHQAALQAVHLAEV